MSEYVEADIKLKLDVIIGRASATDSAEVALSGDVEDSPIKVSIYEETIHLNIDQARALAGHLLSAIDEVERQKARLASLRALIDQALIAQGFDT